MTFADLLQELDKIEGDYLIRVHVLPAQGRIPQAV